MLGAAREVAGMPGWLISILGLGVVVLGGLLAVRAIRARSGRGTTSSPSPPLPGALARPEVVVEGRPTPATPPAGLRSRAELCEQLAEFAGRCREPEPPPVDRAPAAMCYSVSVRPEEPAFYLCPSCGQRTLWNLGSLLTSLRALRAQADALAELGVWVTVEERSFCRQCSPGESLPTLELRLRLDGGGQARKLDSYDLECLLAFLRGQADRVQAADIPRLERLLSASTRDPRTDR